MEGCRLEGVPVAASPVEGRNRKLSHTAESILLPAGWVGFDTHRTSRIARVGIDPHEATLAGSLPVRI